MNTTEHCLNNFMTVWYRVLELFLFYTTTIKVANYYLSINVCLNDTKEIVPAIVFWREQT